MFMKIKVIMVSLALLLILVSTSNASDLWISQKGESGFIGTSDSCVVVTFVNGKTYAPVKAVKRDDAKSQFNWKVRTSAEQAGCDNLMKVAGYVAPKKITVAPNGKHLSRPTYDMTGTVKTGNVVEVGMPCEGSIIKYRYSTKSYYKILGRNETALCGEY